MPAEDWWARFVLSLSPSDDAADSPSALNRAAVPLSSDSR